MLGATLEGVFFNTCGGGWELDAFQAVEPCKHACTYYIVLGKAGLIVRAAAFHDGHFREVGTRQLAACLIALLITSHHGTQAAQVVAVERPLKSQFAHLAHLALHQFGQLARLGEHEGGTGGKADGVGTNFSYRVGSIGPQLVGAVGLQLSEAYLHLSVLFQRTGLCLSRVGALLLSDAATSMGDSLSAVVLYLEAHYHAGGTGREDGERLHAGRVVGDSGKPQSVGGELHLPVVGSHAPVIGGSRGQVAQAHRQCVARRESLCSHLLLQEACFAIVECDGGHWRIALQGDYAVQVGATAFHSCGRQHLQLWLKGAGRFVLATSCQREQRQQRI